MTHEEILSEIAKRLTAKLAEELDGTLSWCQDIDEDQERVVITVSGTCHKIHPDLKDTYGHGWSVMQSYTIDEALERLNLTLELKPC